MRQARGAREPVVAAVVQCLHREERHDRAGAGDPGGGEQLGPRDPVGQLPSVVVRDLDTHAGDRAPRGDDGDRVDDRERIRPVRVPAARQHQTRGLAPRGRLHRQAHAVVAECEGGGVGVGDEAAPGVDEQHRDGGVVGRAHRPAHPGHRPRAVLHELHPVPLAFPLRPPTCPGLRSST
jgi:hypothetical protein